MNLLLPVHAFTSCFMTGLIWFVQIVHYPMFRDVGEDGFRAYEEKHQRLTTWVVAPVMLVELGASVLVFMNATSLSLGESPLWGGVLIVAIWLSTALLQVPMHGQLKAGFSERVHFRLVATNWIRTIAWTARGVLSLTMLH